MKVRPKRKPIKWPDGARIAMTPCVAFETWPEDLGGASSRQQQNRRGFPKNALTKKDLGAITDREFGERVGIYRFLEIFEKEQIKTSFFPTGITVENYPEIFKEAVEYGHEIGTETWIHDYSYMKKRDKEKKDLQKTVDVVKKVIGKAPVGYLSTGIAPSVNTPEVIVECGYTYWMDPQHQETPYTLKVKNKELTVLGYFADLNDYASYQRAGRTPRDLLQMWKDCFDCLYEEGATDPKFMMWGNHPFVGGRPFRAQLLREFIRYAKSHDKVWFAPAGEVAKWYRENYRDAQVEEWPNFAFAGRPGKLSDLTKLGFTRNPRNNYLAKKKSHEDEIRRGIDAVATIRVEARQCLSGTCAPSRRTIAQGIDTRIWRLSSRWEKSLTRRRPRPYCASRKEPRTRISRKRSVAPCSSCRRRD